MRVIRIATVVNIFLSICTAYSTAGIEALVKRRLPEHANAFSFTLSGSTTSKIITHAANDEYTVSNGGNGTINILGNTPIALASGLRYV